jgi:NDP-sugar pyrophosphorylase family protein
MFQHALIMAAGRGSRMMPLTNHIPKAMVVYKGDSLISNGIGKIQKSIPNVYITVGYKGAMLAHHVLEKNVNAIFNTEGRGNSWWIFNTLMRNLDEPVLVLTCDNITDLNFQRLYDDYTAMGNPACMVIPVTPVPGLEGDFIFHEKGLVKELNRHKPGEAYCSGIQILNPAKINGLINPSEDFYQTWMQLIKLEQLFCSNIYPDKWFTIDTLAQLDSLNKMED